MSPPIYQELQMDYEIMPRYMRMWGFQMRKELNGLLKLERMMKVITKVAIKIH